MITTHTVILVFVILFCVFSVKAGIIIESPASLANQNVPGLNKYVIQSILFIASSLQIPYNFFLGKEFVLSMYDEIKHRSLSKKI